MCENKQCKVIKCYLARFIVHGFTILRSSFSFHLMLMHCEKKIAVQTTADAVVDDKESATGF